MTDRLPQDYVPTNYDLYIHFVEFAKTLDSNVTITFKKNKDNDCAYLNIDIYIHIKSITQNGISLKYRVEYPHLIIFRSTDPAMDISDYPISIDYNLDPDYEGDCGFFVSDGYYLTDFEPNDAKTLLPCFDEPFAVSTFSVKVTIPSYLTAISNMPIENITEQGEESLVTFMRTPPMCTYLLCLCVGLFSSIRGVSENDTPIEIYSMTGDESKFKAYLDVAIFSVNWLESTFGVKYQLPHLQLLLHSGFESGMENYGLITLPDYSGKKCSNSRKLVVIHEVIHQWFGDLVSIKWWDSLWLNEGFAEFLQYVILDEYDKECDAMQLFVEEEGLDSLACFNDGALVPPANEIDYDDMFESLIYSKGSFVVKMFYDIIGKEKFLFLCSKWLDGYKNKTVDISDFISFVNSTLNFDYSDFFNTWLKNDGFPSIVVEAVADKNDPEKFVGVELLQVSSNECCYSFKLPILYGKNDEVKRVDVLFDGLSKKVEFEFDWVIVNDNLQALCFVVYSKELLRIIAGMRLAGKISEVNAELIRKSVKYHAVPEMIDDEMMALAYQFK